MFDIAQLSVEMSSTFIGSLFIIMHPRSTISVHSLNTQTLSKQDWISAHKKLQFFVSLSFSSYLLHLPETIRRKLGHSKLAK